jgi:hypothetical protein
MQTIIRNLLITVLGLMPVTMVLAQASAPSMPEAVIKLGRFNGSWQANLTSIMGDKSYQLDYNVKCIPVAAGNGAYWEENATDPNLGEMHASDLFGYDRSDGKLHCYTVDNMGTTRDLVCDWESPDHLVMGYNRIENGKQVTEKLDFTLKEDNILEFTGNSITDGKTQWSGTGTFHRIEGK